MNVALVSGAPGIGKSRLLEEACRHLSWIRCAVELTELDQHVGLGAIIDAIWQHPQVQTVAEALPQPWRSVICQLKVDPPAPGSAERSELAAAMPRPDPRSLQRRALDALLALTSRLASDAPLLISIDNAHYLDAQSACALVHMRRHWSIGSAYVLLATTPTYHDGGCLDSLGSATASLSLELKGIDPSSARNLITEIAGPSISPVVVSYLQRLGCGNPLYLAELTRHWLRQPSGPPLLDHEQVALPETIVGIYRRRLERLGRPARRVADVLAIAHAGLEPQDLGSWTGLNDRDLDEALAELHEERLLRMEQGQVFPSHDLVRQVLLSAMPPALKRRWHSRAVELFGPSARPATIAIHSNEAGRPEDAFRSAQEAAARARERGAFREAIGFLGIATSNAPDASAEGKLAQEAGELRFLTCDFKGAIADLSLALEIFQTTDAVRALECRTTLLACYSHVSMIGGRHFHASSSQLFEECLHRKQWDLAARVLETTADYWDRRGRDVGIVDEGHSVERLLRCSSPRARCIGHRILGRKAFYGDLKQGRVHAERALEIADQHGLHQELLPTLSLNIVALMMSGELHLQRSGGILERAETFAHTTGDIRFKSKVLGNIGVHFLDIGALGRAQYYFDQAPEMANDTTPKNQVLRWSNLGELALRRGALSEALDHFRQGLSYDPQRVFPMGAAVCHAGAGLCALQLGELASAREQESRLDAVLGKGLLPVHLSIVLLVEFRALLEARRGRVSDAHKLVREAMERTRNRRIPTWIQLSMLDASLTRRFGGAKPEVRSRLKKAADEAKRLEMNHRVRQIQRQLTAL